MSTGHDATNWRTEKLVSLIEADAIAAQLREAGKRIVSTNGSFDLLHAGHLDQLEEAKKQGDVLFVGTNTDVAIRSAKGADRPIVPEAQRAAMLAAFACVDYVTILDGYESEPHGTFLPAIRPHVHVNGPDYGAPETWVEWPAMTALGIEGYTCPRRNTVSTSEILEKIHNTHTFQK